MLIIFVQSSFPAIELPPVDIISTDKLIHAGVYGLLAALCYISLAHASKDNFFSRYPIMWSVIIPVIYGASDEIHQYYVPNRSAEVLDWVADVVGVVIMFFLIKYYLQNKYKLFRKAA